MKKCIFISFLLIGCQTRSINTNSSINEVNSENKLKDGFTIRATSKKDNKNISEIILENSQGSIIASSQIQINTLNLSQEVLADGSIIFKWPSTNEIQHRDYDFLAKNVIEYSTLVGTLLYQNEVFGNGAKTWWESLRGEQNALLNDAHNKAKSDEATRSGENWPQNINIENISTPWCEEVIEQFVDKLVPIGSRFRQYGNCGEGGRVLACLAKNIGFSEEEIQLCASANDHFFAMVNKESSTCIMDRWAIGDIKNFKCNVTVNSQTNKVEDAGLTVNHKWYENVACVSLKQYLINPITLYTLAFSTIKSEILNENGDFFINKTCWVKKDTLNKIDNIRLSSQERSVKTNQIRALMIRDSCMKRLADEDLQKISYEASDPILTDITQYLLKYRFKPLW